MIPGVDGKQRKKTKRCKTETTLNANTGRYGRWGPYGAGMVKRQDRRTEARIKDLWPKEKQRKSRVPGKLQLGSPSLLLPQKSLLNSHFSHTILPRRFPQLQDERQLEDVNKTAREALPFRVTKIHFRPSRLPPRLSYTWKAAGGINASAEAGLPSWPASPLLRLAVRP